MEIQNRLTDSALTSISMGLEDAVYQFISSVTVVMNSELQSLSRASELNSGLNTQRLNFYRVNDNTFRGMKSASD